MFFTQYDLANSGSSRRASNPGAPWVYSGMMQGWSGAALEASNLVRKGSQSFSSEG